MLRRVLRVLQGGIMFSVRVVQRRRCAHSQQVIEVQPNLGVHLVPGRLLGLVDNQEMSRLRPTTRIMS